MIELDPSCDTWMVSEINFSICHDLSFLLGINLQVGVMRFLLIVTLLKYILFKVTISYIFE